MIKIKRTYNIEAWNKEISTSDYSLYFTQSEIECYSKKRSKGSLVARYLIKEILMEYISGLSDFTAIEILNNSFGKPILKVEGSTQDVLNQIYFSLSHCKTEVAVLVVIDSYDK